MSSKLPLLAFITCLLITSNSNAQTEDLPKREIAAEFATLNRDSFSGIRTEAGFGGRFTLNLNENVALEAAGFFFPRSCFDCRDNGKITEAVAGIKAGKRFQKWGLFAKARPGIVRFSRGRFNVISAPPTPFDLVAFEIKPLTHFAVDVGGVVEFYHSRRIVTRFDFGDTIINSRRRTQNFLQFDPVTGQSTLFPIPVPGRTSHNFQFSASVGFRW